ncbi:hypothetical protein FisN_6Lh112 [Fistulifera solaris]|uniref:Uncharacterized protein n=1 Tax=Fistulifera solaris TaxID=1519565 RepID=A0A1Z5J691_FISSO|nr:hypothetical protein FisN_6Lh112 [Fistulifera solaris]|eukprot:GAX09500.1 hypothetical protein FisN_6Lh112 [Fistulifera solaris]
MKLVIRLLFVFAPVNSFFIPIPKTIKLTQHRAFGSHYDFNYVLAKARVCAYSDHATPAEAFQFLQEILAMEDACRSGSLSGEPRCEDIAEIADTVAHLRGIILRNDGEERGFSMLDGAAPCTPLL